MQLRHKVLQRGGFAAAAAGKTCCQPSSIRPACISIPQYIYIYTPKAKGYNGMVLSCALFLFEASVQKKCDQPGSFLFWIHFQPMQPCQKQGAGPSLLLLSERKFSFRAPLHPCPLLPPLPLSPSSIASSLPPLPPSSSSRLLPLRSSLSPPPPLLLPSPDYANRQGRQTSLIGEQLVLWRRSCLEHLPGGPGPGPSFVSYMTRTSVVGTESALVKTVDECTRIMS